MLRVENCIFMADFAAFSSTCLRNLFCRILVDFIDFLPVSFGRVRPFVSLLPPAPQGHFFFFFTNHAFIITTFLCKIQEKNTKILKIFLLQGF
jgi:hypothetical protein